MADKISKEHRSWVMSRIKNKDTKPEKLLRSLLHREGYRFRLHVRNLPGKPDVVFPKYKTVIFVHGCFWHRHEGCPNATTPKTRVAFWEGKFKRTMERDRQNQRELMALGWRVIVVWECELKRNRNELIANLKDKLTERKQIHVGCCHNDKKSLWIISSTDDFRKLTILQSFHVKSS